MTWQYELIGQYFDWLKRQTLEAGQIPPIIQVGKILEFLNGDETGVEGFIDDQIEADNNPMLDTRILSDGYWERVRKEFREIQANQLIMAE